MVCAVSPRVVNDSGPWMVRVMVGCRVVRKRGMGGRPEADGGRRNPVVQDLELELRLGCLASLRIHGTHSPYLNLPRRLMEAADMQQP